MGKEKRMMLRLAVALGAFWFLLGLVGLVLHEAKQRRTLCVGLLLCASALLLTASAQHWGLEDGRTATALVLCLVPVLVFGRRLPADGKQG